MELSELTGKLRREAGFEVYFCASRTQHLNDWPVNYEEREFSYTRGVHNLRFPEKSILSSIQRATEARMGGCLGGDTDFNSVGYGLLPAKKRVVVDVPVIEPVERRKKGLRGLWGHKETVFVESTEEKKVSVYDGNLPISEILLSKDERRAFFAKLTINSKFTDSPGRPPSGHPCLTIIGDIHNIWNLKEYLLNNPQNYMPFIREMLPVDEFPNINRHILDQANPFDKLVFLDAEEIDKSRPTHGINKKLKPWVYEEYGQNVKVPKS